MLGLRSNREIETAVILGAGNVAWHIGHQLLKAGVRVIQVYNRSAVPGERLAVKLGTTYTSMLEYLNKKADLYVLAVTDDAVGRIANTGCFLKKHLVIHMAGSVNMDVFAGKVENYGVLYPLQTFSKGRVVDFNSVPLFIEANSKDNLKLLKRLAYKLSDRVYEVDSEKRIYLHLAAVIASNFTNHLYAVTEKLLKERGLSLEVLKPLIEETIAKALSMPPHLAQTGPAARGNLEVIGRHMAILDKHPEIKELYRVLTESIMAAGNTASQE